jgi:hypothetical protein
MISAYSPEGPRGLLRDPHYTGLQEKVEVPMGQLFWGLKDPLIIRYLLLIRAHT